MSHYKKLAIVIIRIISCCVSLFGLLGMGFGLVIIKFDREASGVYFYSSLVYLLAGLILFGLSRWLATLAASGLAQD
jgi:hypothetical protein